MPRKKKKKEEPKVVPSFTIASCQWCGMQWKHFEGSPPHFCGKVCEAHSVVTPEEAEDMKGIGFTD